MEAVPTIVENFHFLRPLFFLGLIPAALIVATLSFQNSKNTNWSKAIDPSLLPFLLENKVRSRQNLPLYGLLIIWVLSLVALAGPVWEKIPAPVQEREDAMVLVQDLSLSMNSTDLNPNRLTRSKRKLLDILNSRKDEGQTALVVYAGSAHIVTPLTDDIATISNMVSALEPGIMPVLGSKPEAAISLAVELLNNAQLSQASIMLISDGINNTDINAIQNILSTTNHRLLVLGVGTEEGAPIPTREGFLRDNNNAIVVPKLNRELLLELSSSVDGRYTDMVLTDDDINFLMDKNFFEENQNLRDAEQEFDTWAEAGPWLLLLVLPFAALAFRRGWLLSLALLVIIAPDRQAYALEWKDLWENKNQQGSKEFTSENFDDAAQLFEDNSWRAAANYKNGNYEAALAEFNQLEGIDATYNKANTLAKLNRYEDAISTYDEVIAQQANHTDAILNRDIVQKLLEEQQEQEELTQNQQEQEREGSEDEQESENEQTESEQQNQDQSAEQSEQEEENSEQNSEEQQQSESTDSDAGQEAENEEESEPSEEQSIADQGESEEDQAMQQWLGRIEDDPGELLRNKFRYQTQQLLYQQLQSPRMFENTDQGQTW